MYRDLARLLGDEQPFYGLQEDKEDDGANLQDTVEGMAAHYLEQVVAFQPQGPYLLGGYSFGGVVAFEMARQLQARGEQVALLALFDTGQPEHREVVLADARPERVQGKYSETDWITFLKTRPASFRRAWGRLVVRLLFHWCRARGRPLPVKYRNAGRFLFYQLARKQYHPGPYAGDLTLFRVMGSPLRPAPEGDLGWGETVTGRIEIVPVPGHHDDMLKPGQVEALAEALGARLRRAQGGGEDE